MLLAHTSQPAWLFPSHTLTQPSLRHLPHTLAVRQPPRRNFLVRGAGSDDESMRRRAITIITSAAHQRAVAAGCDHQPPPGTSTHPGWQRPRRQQGVPRPPVPCGFWLLAVEEVHERRSAEAGEGGGGVLPPIATTESGYVPLLHGASLCPVGAPSKGRIPLRRPAQQPAGSVGASAERRRSLARGGCPTYPTTTALRTRTHTRDKRMQLVPLAPQTAPKCSFRTTARVPEDVAV